MHNTIILTSGLTGSSVLTGLLARGGYWPGNRTVKKADYDTVENEDLVQLNLALLQRAAYDSTYQTRFSLEMLDRVGTFAREIDLEPYRDFLRRCEAHRPWVWKDPRLWVTIRFWHQVVDLSTCNFLLLTRNHFQCWVSTNSRRIIQSYRHTRSYERAIADANVAFLEENRLPYQHVTYDELIAEPDLTLARLNRFLGASFTLADLAAVYRGPLHKRPGSSLTGSLKAGLIFAKNYHQRVDRGQLPARFPIKLPPVRPESPSPRS
jgi:hypothetical protein